MTSLLLMAGMTLGATGCAHGSNSDSDPASKGASSSDGAAASGTSGQGKQTKFIVPEAAKAHTNAGAIAFVKFYWEMSDKLNAHPETGVIPQFSSTGCTLCAMQEQTLKSLATSGAHVKTAGAQLTGFTVRAEPVGGSVTVISCYSTTPTRLRHESIAMVRSTRCRGSIHASAPVSTG